MLVACEPAFITPKLLGAAYPALLGLALLFCALTTGWLSAYAIALARAGDVLRRPRVQRTIDAITEAALVALGIRLAATDR